MTAVSRRKRFRNDDCEHVDELPTCDMTSCHIGLGFRVETRHLTDLL